MQQYNLQKPYFTPMHGSAFIGLSYVLRLIEGVANAATNSQGIGILLMFFPGRQALVTAYTDMFIGNIHI